ncbi:MAG: PQQ-dependent sugar dehydrogenase, partial [Actinomycetota bacterium]|nr:PQQ-dependent sugar dehydrogenase [Actinomycetota bacterium]
MRRASGLLALLVCLAAAAPAAAAPRLTPVGSFDQPVFLTAPPQDPQRLFVVEKPGRVKVIVDGGAPQTFLDIAAEVDEQGEEGLLSIAFAPDYATSRRFYAYFTAVDATMGGGSMLKIVEFTRPEATPDSAAGAARRTLLEIPHPTASNHNGGQLQIGPDGLLWIATGDGAVSATTAQDPNTLLGKLLRIDPTPSGTAQYSIPPDNPFANGVGGRPEVWAIGLRNPWRFSFDRQTGDLVLGDVGGGKREEIDFAPKGTGAGANYGWPCREGRDAGPVACVAPGAVEPVFDYPHSTETCSGVVAGYVVRDPRLPTLLGRHLYTDLCWSSPHSHVLAQPDATGDREETGLVHGGTVSFGEDSCGHVFIVSINGPVARVDDEPFMS